MPPNITGPSVGNESPNSPTNTENIPIKGPIREDELHAESRRIEEAPQTSETYQSVAEAKPEAKLEAKPEAKQPEPQYKRHLVWRNIIWMALLHVYALYGVYLMFASARIYTSIWAYFMYVLGGLGITAGAHRLWAHKSYKAKWPLRLFLTVCNTIAFQDSVIDWSRDHRMHHKYSDTDADPHNATRGFFFSHVGWLLCRKHHAIKAKGHNVDLSDLYSDPILRFQKKHYLTLMPLFCFLLPVAVPMYFWGETFANSFIINLLRYAFTLNITWLVNSAAHLFGYKPYDKNILPSENIFVAILALGEGWHNYHHTFPWDYKTAELGKYSTNFTSAFIDTMAKLGLAYDLKTVSSDMIRKRAMRTGGDHGEHIWGWGDKDQSVENQQEALIRYQKDE